MSQSMEQGRQWLLSALAWLAGPVEWLVRLYLAKVFFLSGWVKWQDWESTLYLFRYEYRVPGLPPEWAAWLATGSELLLPVLLVLGLGTRLAAGGLWILNLVAVIAYYHVLKTSPAALQDHLQWGLLLSLLLVRVPAAWGLDHWLARRRALKLPAGSR